MYTPLRSLVVRCLRVPAAPPVPPAGSYASVQVFRASPRYLTYKLLLFYVGCVVGSAAMLVALSATLIAGKYWATALILGIAAVIGFFASLNWFAVRIDYDLRHYLVTDRSLRVREGVWIFKEMTLTYANVQNLRIVQGPLQRAFGISDLLVDTAGGGASGKHERGGAGGHQVRLAGIENARDVRDLILGYVRQFNRGSGLGDLDDVEHRSQRAASAAPAPSAELVQALRGVHDAASALRHALGA